MTKKLVLYRKTVLIQAEQFDGSASMISKYGIHPPKPEQIGGQGSAEWTPMIDTLEGTLQIKPGDWIATGANRENWPIADEVFHETYEQLPILPRPVARLLDHSKEVCDSLAVVMHDAVVMHQSRKYGRGMFSDISEIKWIADHPLEFARAWLDGYMIEEDAHDNANS